MPDEHLHNLVLSSDRTGRSLGITSEAAHRRWAYVMLRTDGRALEQPGLRSYLTDRRLSADEKMVWLLRSISVTEQRMQGAS